MDTLFDKESEYSGFIKTTVSSLSPLSREQKVVLNRKGNELFNRGEIEKAKRIFITTGYSDGLTRVGDVYMNQNKPLTALKLYLLAHNRRKIEPIAENLAKIISLELHNI